MTTHSGLLAWKIPWTEEFGRLQPMGSKESDTTERLSGRAHRFSRGVCLVPFQAGCETTWGPESLFTLAFLRIHKIYVTLISGLPVLVAPEKAMAPHSRALAWKIPWTAGGAWWAAVHGVTQSQTQLSDFTFTHWRRKWQPTPVFLPGESRGRGSLVGCRLWGCTESDTTEAT